MTEVKDKLVTVESIGALHEYNMQRVIDVAHGGTGATNPKDARANLGAAAANKINHANDNKEAYVTSNVEMALNSLSPIVNIAAIDKGNDSEGAMIRVADYSDEGIVDQSGYIKLQANEIEIDAGIMNVNTQMIKGKLTGDVKLDGDLTVNGSLIASSETQFKNDMNIGEFGIHVGNIALKDSVLNVEGKSQFHAFGLNVKSENDIDLDIGRDGYKYALFDTYLSGNNVGIRANGSLYITSYDTGDKARVYGKNVKLWKGFKWMGYTNNKVTDLVEISLDYKVSEQPHGIVLVFSKYNYGTTSHAEPASGKVFDDNFHTFFVPKEQVIAHPGDGMNFIMMQNHKLYYKYLHIYDSKIVGSENNMYENCTCFGQTGSNTVNNREFVLRAVYGV